MTSATGPSPRTNWCCYAAATNRTTWPPIRPLAPVTAMRNTPSGRPGRKTLVGARDQNAPFGRSNSAGRSRHEAVQNEYFACS